MCVFVSVLTVALPSAAECVWIRVSPSEFPSGKQGLPPQPNTKPSHKHDCSVNSAFGTIQIMQ